MKRYGIMVCIDGDDDWMFVTEDSGEAFIRQPILFDDFDEALIAAENWIEPGKEENVMVVEYEG